MIALKIHRPPPEAKKRAELKMGPKHERFLAALRKAGANGLTDEELMLQLGTSKGDANGRRGELVLLGLAEDSGRTRQTTRGRKATVWTFVRTISKTKRTRT